jgi:hypothetical protein
MLVATYRLGVQLEISIPIIVQVQNSRLQPTCNPLITEESQLYKPYITQMGNINCEIIQCLLFILRFS